MTQRQKEEIVYNLIDYVYSDTYELITQMLFDREIVDETNNEYSEYVLQTQSMLFRHLNNLMLNKQEIYQKQKQ